MDVFQQQRGWWGYHPGRPRPLSVVEMIRAGTIDAELAALLWLLIEGRVPVVVASGPPLAGKTTLLTALMDFLPPDVEKLFLRGWAEDFAWLPDAEGLGWPGWAESGVLPGAADPRKRETPDVPVADPARTYLLAAELSSHLPVYTWALHARVLVRALQRGYGLGTCLHAASLEEVLAQLQAPPVSLTADEVRFLGVVIILRVVDAGAGAAADPRRDGGGTAPLRRRAVAVHYLRPPERDRAGHIQRRPPAVLATWDRHADRFEHFAWGITPELADRVGRRQDEFERLHRDRAAFLAALAETGSGGLAEVRRALDDHRRVTTLGSRRANQSANQPQHGHAVEGTG